MTAFYDIAYRLAEDQVQQAVLHPKGGIGQPLFEAMAAFAGRSDWTHAYSVVFQPGAGVSEHDHPEDVVLYYPDEPLTGVIVADELIIPEAGQMILIPKLVRHEVPLNEDDKPRVSIALKVTDE